MYVVFDTQVVHVIILAAFCVRKFNGIALGWENSDSAYGIPPYSEGHAPNFIKRR